MSNINIDWKNSIILIILFLPVQLLFAQTAGPNNAGLITSGGCIFSSSGVNYASPASAATSNNVYSTAFHCACCDQHTNCMRFTNFGFAIPATSVITGIKVDIEKKSDFGMQVEDNGMSLLKGGVEVGNNYSMYGVAWPYTDTYVTYGGCGNMWGTTWTVADINSPNFGIEFTSIDYSCTGGSSYIDHVQITICYNSTLPIDIRKFDAKRERESVKLEWEVFAENNCNYFTVEHSVDGEKYNLIGNIPATGNMGETTLYNFFDEHPVQGENYYRLSMYDQNGNCRSLEPAVVNFDELSIFNCQPFFTENGLELWLSCDKNSRTQVQLINLAGQILFEEYFVTTNGRSHRFFAIANLIPGIYFVKVMNDEGLCRLVKISRPN